MAGKSKTSTLNWVLGGVALFFLLCCGGTCALDAVGVIDLDEIQEEMAREMTTDAPKGK